MASSTAIDKVQVLQRTLYRTAKADPGRRFHALFDKVYRRDVLERAWSQVRANWGAPGIDDMSIADVEAFGVARMLHELGTDLKVGSWRPLPARRVWISKPGSDEQRPLSIPAVRDRVVQAAAKIVLEPVFEADFLPCSFGFRPKRSAHAAAERSPSELAGTCSQLQPVPLSEARQQPCSHAPGRCLPGSPSDESWHHRRTPTHCEPSRRELLAIAADPDRPDRCRRTLRGLQPCNLSPRTHASHDNARESRRRCTDEPAPVPHHRGTTTGAPARSARVL